MMRSDYEKETIILTNEADDFWNILTYNADLKRRLSIFAAEHPMLCALKKNKPDGSVEYKVQKDGVFIDFRQSDEDIIKEELVQRLAKKRFRMDE